jgi:sigma-E factor negative regulatory protein RseC
MIEESGQVVELDGEFAWIESERSTACGGCAARKGCGTGAIARVLGQRPVRLRVLNRVNAAVGDRVVVGISETGLLKGSLAVYAAPLAALFAGALGGHYLAALLWPAVRDPLAIAGAVIGLSAGLLWLRNFGQRTGNHAAYQPVVLRKQLTASFTGNVVAAE